VARAALRVIVDEGLVEASARLGARLLADLRSIPSTRVKEVRGRGLMIAIELHADAGGARTVCEQLLERGLLAKETHEHIIRIAPPLVLTEEQSDWIASQFDAVLH
jgi:ornithine--oxo-acid transaminase